MKNNNNLKNKFPVISEMTDDDAPRTWLFQRNKDSVIRSFSVTIIHGGTYVLTGDYGTLTLNRDSYTRSGSWQRGMINWAAGVTNIAYFAEKVCQFGIEQKIKEFKITRAIEEIKENMGSWDLEPDDTEDFLQELSFFNDANEDKLIEMFIDYSLHDACSQRYGVDYTEKFKYMFELFQLWANHAYGG